MYTPLCEVIEDNSLFSSEDEVNIIQAKTRGTKKGCKIDLISLNPGGFSEHDCRAVKSATWNLESKRVVEDNVDENLDDRSYSLTSSDGAWQDDYEFSDYDKLEDYCVTDVQV